MSNVKTWANRTKQAAASVPLTTGAKRDGKRYRGILESATPKVFKTGSYGLELKYSVQGLEKPVYENIVITDAKGNATKYGKSSAIRRFQAFGLTSSDTNGMDFANLDLREAGLEGAPVALYLADEEYMGKPRKRVRAVFGQDNTEGGNEAA